MTATLRVVVWLEKKSAGLKEQHWGLRLGTVKDVPKACCSVAKLVESMVALSVGSKAGPSAQHSAVH